ncbi:reticulocyte-binding protein 2 homolog a-like [Chelonus insularis]|uniref:reticulocyte-binding protein 2 homolog a-like n=1 Tax=Chelonus insularis TaxID=460826 RepID=UPI00158E031A|nr:reticulocyte-binding protein 2 homolog a-like [Chelonus insularis]KAG8148297.1 BVpp85_like protein [Chelonus insularis]
MDTSIPNISGEINSVDSSINSLIDFIDNKVIKYFDNFLEKLESAYVSYMSQVADKKIQPSPNEFKKAKVKYDKLNNSIHRFLSSITQDYMNLLQIGYKIKSFYEMLNHYSDQIAELEKKNNVDELRDVTHQVSQINSELEKLVVDYNQEISKLNFLQLNFKNKMIIYQSPSAGETFSISLKVFNQQLDNLIESNKSTNKEQIFGKLLQQFPEQLQSISKEPPLELLAVRPVKPQILKQPQVSGSNEIIDITYSLLEPYTRKVIDPAYREHRFVGSDDSDSTETEESEDDKEEYISDEEEEEMRMKAEETTPEEEKEEARVEKISEESLTTPSSVTTQRLEEPMATERPSTSRDYEEQAEPLIKIDIPEISVREEYQKQLGDLLESVNIDERTAEEIAIDNYEQITYQFFLDTLERLDRQIDQLNDREYELIPRSRDLRKRIKGLKEFLETAQSQIEIDRYQNELQMVLKSFIQLKEDDEAIQQTKYKLFEVKEKLFKKWQNELERNAQMLATESDRVMEYEGQSGSPLEKLEQDRDQLIRMVDSLKDEVDYSIDSYTERKKERDMYLKKEASLFGEV